MEEPRRRPRSPAKKAPTRERPDGGGRNRPEDEDDYATVTNWREFLDDDEETGDVKLLPGEEPKSKSKSDEPEEEDDWRKYIDSDEEEGGGSLGDRFKK